MGTCFKIFRFILSLLFSAVLFLLIVVGIPLSSLSKVLTNPENVKSWLDQSNVYEEISKSLSKSFKQDSQGDNSKYFESDQQDEFNQVVEKVLPAAWLQETTEMIIDSVYSWLEGETSSPEFEIDISENLALAQEEIIKLTTDEFYALPTCSESQMEQYSEENLNPIEANCLPVGFDMSEEDFENKIREELNKQDVFQKDVISSNDMFNITEQASKTIQLGYDVFKKMQLIVIISVLLVTLLLFVLIPGLAGKFLMTGSIWVVSGALLMFANLYSNAQLKDLFDKRVQDLPSDQVELINQVFDATQKYALNDFWKDVRQLALVVIVIGVVLMIGGIILLFTKKRTVVEIEEEKDDSKKSDQKENNKNEDEKESDNIKENNGIAEEVESDETEMN